MLFCEVSASSGLNTSEAFTELLTGRYKYIGCVKVFYWCVMSKHSFMLLCVEIYLNFTGGGEGQWHCEAL